MGGKNSKSHKIMNYKNVKIPPNCRMLKIITFNVGISNVVSLNDKVEKFIEYILSDYRNISFDIICVQGINDHQSLKLLLRSIRDHYKITKLYYAPNDICLHHLSDGDLSQANSLELTTSRTFNDIHMTNTKIGNTKFQNIIISKYPILTTIYGELDDLTNIDDVLGIQTVIGGNVLIGNNIVSIYNTSFCKDIRSANIINDDAREKEISALFGVIAENRKTLKKYNENKNYNIVHTAFIVGTLNIKDKIDKLMNEEYINLLQNYHCLDIYRYMYHDNGYTTTLKERIDYILINLPNELYDTKFFDSIKTDRELYKTIFKKYNIHFLDIYVCDNDEFDNSFSHYPVECVFLIKNN